MKTPTPPTTPETGKIIKAREDLERHNAEANAAASLKAHFEFRPAEIEEGLEKLLIDLAVAIVDQQSGADRAEEVASLWDQISKLKAEAEIAPRCALDCERRRLRAVYRARDARRVLDDLKIYYESKQALADENYTGTTAAMRASRRVEDLAPRLGLEADLADFYSWLREKKAKTYWSPGDKRGIQDGASK